MTRNVELDTSKIYVIGHSFDAGVALAAQARERRIKKIVLIGPPRRLSERSLGENATDKEYFLQRWKKDMELAYPLQYSIWKKVYENLDIETYEEEFQAPGHIPIFLIDGEKEGSQDLAFLNEVYQKISPPAEYWTIDDTGHYMKTKFSDEKVCFNKTIMIPFIKRVDEWLQQSR